MTNAALAVAAVGGCGLAYGAPQLGRRRNVAALERRCRRRRAVVLTYDDGPSPASTPALLDLLAEHDAHATFFVLGAAMERAPELVERMRAEGHELGAHGEAHVHPLKALPPRLVRDTWSGCRRLEGTARWFRPTYGKLTLGNYVPARLLGMKPMWWTMDSGDTHDHRPHPEQIADALRRTGGGVLLLHDLDRSAARIDLALQITERVLDMASAESLNVMTLHDLSDPMAGS